MQAQELERSPFYYCEARHGSPVNIGPSVLYFSCLLKCSMWIEYFGGLMSLDRLNIAVTCISCYWLCVLWWGRMAAICGVNWNDVIIRAAVLNVLRISKIRRFLAVSHGASTTCSSSFASSMGSFKPPRIIDVRRTYTCWLYMERLAFIAAEDTFEDLMIISWSQTLLFFFSFRVLVPGRGFQIVQLVMNPLFIRGYTQLFLNINTLYRYTLIWFDLKSRLLFIPMLRRCCLVSVKFALMYNLDLRF